MKKRWKLAGAETKLGGTAVFLVFLCIVQNMGAVLDGQAVAKHIQKKAEEQYLPSLSYLKAEDPPSPGEWIAEQAMRSCLRGISEEAAGVSGIGGG